MVRPAHSSHRLQRDQLLPSGDRHPVRALGDLPWPPAGTLVSVLHGRRLRPPDNEITLAAGDRVSLLIPVPQGSQPSHADGGTRDHVASHEAGDGSSTP